ncbi:MAG: PQQ-binding-like beta-propeller repeat protein [Streptomycetaceae bacterium]|nr:PQQ-binding-like beta-propeller repeat protein [Streptomycetaceae bacterium]
MKINIGKVIAGCGAGVMLAVLGVVAVQAQEVSSCWNDFDKLTDNQAFPDAYTVKLIDSYDDPGLRAAQRDPAYKSATSFTGDAAVGAPLWTIATQGPAPQLRDQFGLLTARGGEDPGDLAMYEGRNGKRHWMRTATKPADYFMKNLRAMTFVPQSDGTTHAMGADARSGYLQWCESVPLTPTAARPDQDTGWATELTGNGRTVLLVGRPDGGKPGTSAVAYQDVVTGKVTRKWDVEGTWTDVASDGKLVYLAAPGSVAAYKPGVPAPVWKAPVPDGAEVSFTAVQDGLVLVGSRPAAGGPGALTALDATGRQVWSLRGSDPAESQVAGDMVLLHEKRPAGDFVAAYRIADATPVWSTPVPGLTSLADGGADGTSLYLPGKDGPRVLRLADGVAQPTTLHTPVDRVFVSGQRIVMQHTASPELAWTIAYLTPKAQGDTGGGATDPRQR